MVERSDTTGDHYHLVFGTRNRDPNIDSAWRSRLHEYLGGTIRGLGGFPEEVGGVADHVHVLAGLKATHCLADVMRELKKASSMWVHEELGVPHFAWQEGYAAFTLSATARESVRAYIANQQEHHRVRTFREEVIQMLEEAGVAYDPKYLERAAVPSSNCWHPFGVRVVSIVWSRWYRPAASTTG